MYKTWPNDDLLLFMPNSFNNADTGTKTAIVHCLTFVPHRTQDERTTEALTDTDTGLAASLFEDDSTTYLPPVAVPR